MYVQYKNVDSAEAKRRLVGLGVHIESYYSKGADGSVV